MKNEPVISVRNFKKSYGSVEAVKDISLEIQQGEMFGIVGPDGAGKTTTIRALCALTSVYAGELTVLGKDCRKDAPYIHSHIGYLSQKFSLYGDLSIDENIEFFAEIHGVTDYNKRRDELLEFTRLTQFRERRADALSGGMKQKLALACSLIHKPRLLFLDEPTTGVDPVSRRDFWKILNNLVEEKLTIVLTTPYLDEAERCTRIAMMNEGEIIAHGTVTEIKQGLGKMAIEIGTKAVKQTASLISGELQLKPQLFGDRVFLLSDEPEATKKQLDEILAKNNISATMRILSPSLENVFIEKLGGGVQ